MHDAKEHLEHNNGYIFIACVPFPTQAKPFIVFKSKDIEVYVPRIDTYAMPMPYYMHGLACFYNAYKHHSPYSTAHCKTYKIAIHRTHPCHRFLVYAR